MSRIAVALGIAGVAAFAAISSARAKANLALHKPVLMSSVRLGYPAGLVNGIIEWGSFAAHTQNDSPAWILIDLERSARLDEVRLYNRGDGFYVEPTSPISVEVSLDGVDFTPAGSCAEIFTQASPCVVDVHGARARYVRILHFRHLVLSEVEVLGSP